MEGKITCYKHEDQGVVLDECGRLFCPQCQPDRIAADDDDSAARQLAQLRAADNRRRAGY